MSKQPRYEVRIQVDIRDRDFGGQLSMNEVMPLDCTDFLQMSYILGQFHELAMKLKTKPAT